MREYIVALTDGLIGRHRFYEAKDMKWDRFLEYVQQRLELVDVRDMNPATLGKIMCAFETEDVLTSRQELMNHVNFTGDCDDFLREVVSYCLALAIYARLNEFDSGDIPPYRRSDHQLVRR